jgi:hypothetical protein
MKPMIAAAYAHPTGTVSEADAVCAAAPSVPAVFVSALISCIGITYNRTPTTRKITPNTIRLTLIFYLLFRFYILTKPNKRLGSF